MLQAKEAERPENAQTLPRCKTQSGPTFLCGPHPSFTSETGRTPMAVVRCNGQEKDGELHAASQGPGVPRNYLSLHPYIPVTRTPAKGRGKWLALSCFPQRKI